MKLVVPARGAPPATHRSQRARIAIWERPQRARRTPARRWPRCVRCRPTHRLAREAAFLVVGLDAAARPLSGAFDALTELNRAAARWLAAEQPRHRAAAPACRARRASRRVVLHGCDRRRRRRFRSVLQSRLRLLARARSAERHSVAARSRPAAIRPTMPRTTCWAWRCRRVRQRRRRRAREGAGQAAVVGLRRVGGEAAGGRTGAERSRADQDRVDRPGHSSRGDRASSPAGNATSRSSRRFTSTPAAARIRPNATMKRSRRCGAPSISRRTTPRRTCSSAASICGAAGHQEAIDEFKISIWSHDTVAARLALAEAYIQTQNVAGGAQRAPGRAEPRAHESRRTRHARHACRRNRSERALRGNGFSRGNSRESTVRARMPAILMSDEGVHEIQLNGKQLVFMFMAATVVAVVIFLCGVMVGRGVRAPRATELADAAIETPLDPTAAVSAGAASTVGPTPRQPDSDARDADLSRPRLGTRPRQPPETLKEPVRSRASRPRPQGDGSEPTAGRTGGEAPRDARPRRQSRGADAEASVGRAAGNGSWCRSPR